MREERKKRTKTRREGTCREARGQQAAELVIPRIIKQSNGHNREANDRQTYRPEYGVRSPFRQRLAVSAWVTMLVCLPSGLCILPQARFLSTGDVDSGSSTQNCCMTCPTKGISRMSEFSTCGVGIPFPVGEGVRVGPLITSHSPAPESRLNHALLFLLVRVLCRRHAFNIMSIKLCFAPVLRFTLRECFEYFQFLISFSTG